MKVLLFGRNPATVSRVTAALSAAGLAADGVASEEAALARLGVVDALVLGAGVVGDLRERVTAAAARHGVVCVQGPHILPSRDALEYVRTEILPLLAQRRPHERRDPR
ncbi:hypothetical protein [Amycolatopsis australiensis]|uniref:Uncharacterized protein n=1 Tax=Amycolatopsis australiensis TaxID=546364 RepID=A0A1K1T4Q8_9PSEU|nr:hypothetical protein [Amycolatopsis australiensis]SFW91327.1 hypothetical protein SAMN04489730_7916 [Amycolatopsis australiensis]